MKGRARYGLVGVVLAAVLAGIGVAATTATANQKKDKVTLQLKWVTQAQFAGYYAAKAKGYYDQAGLDVNIKTGGPDIIPEQVVLGGQAQFGIDWLPSLLATRDKGGDLVNIGQVFTRSGVTELTWKYSKLSKFCQLKHKKVGVWLGGNEFEQFAALQKCGIDPYNKKDVTIFAQPFDMQAFLKGQIDAASAMTYNELAQVLEVKDAQSGKLHQLSELNVFKMQDQGTGMLEDGIFVKGSWIKDKKNQGIATRFLQASFKGWIYCRDHLDDCVNIVLKNGPTLGRGHQRWQMNEINALIWPTAGTGVGVMDKASYGRTAQISQKFKIVKKAPAGAYIDTYAKAAVAALKASGSDVVGASWKKANVKVTEGGK